MTLAERYTVILTIIGMTAAFLIFLARVVWNASRKWALLAERIQGLAQAVSDLSAQQRRIGDRLEKRVERLETRVNRMENTFRQRR